MSLWFVVVFSLLLTIIAAVSLQLAKKKARALSCKKWKLKDVGPCKYDDGYSSWDEGADLSLLDKDSGEVVTLYLNHNHPNRISVSTLKKGEDVTLLFTAEACHPDLTDMLGGADPSLFLRVP